jgi:hypothetical protein
MQAVSSAAASGGSSARPQLLFSMYADKGDSPMHRFVSPIRVVCVLICALVLTDRAVAESRLHSSRGTAQFVSATEFVGSGVATHLGRYSEAGTVSFTPTSDPAVLHVDGSIVYTAANGDELHASISGELNTATGVVAASVSYVGGTGRFANATGTSSLSGQLGADGAISVTVRGKIDY